MMKPLATLFLGGGIVLGTLPGLAAGGPSEQPQAGPVQRELLAARSKELSRRLHRPIAARSGAATEVAHKNQIRRQQREIQALIERLEAGESVAPGEVERLLRSR